MLTLYYAPRTRTTGVKVLLEELGAEYDLHVLNIRGQRTRDFLAVNPLGKVPTIVHDGAVITEQAAIYQYLADEFPQRGLAPAIGDPLRGPYLRWLAFYGASFEPAMVDKHEQRDPGNRMMSPYGSYDQVVDLLERQLAGPFILGERFTAADVLWGTALGWMLQFGLLPERPAFTAYAGRIAGRAAARRVNEEDAALSAMQQSSGAAEMNSA
jgi:glutathione S-transferase